MRTTIVRDLAGGALAGLICHAAGSASGLVLANKNISLTVHEKSGTMIRLENKLTGEPCSITGDEFAVKTIGWQVDFSDAKLASLTQELGKITARYDHPKLTAEVVYSLGAEPAFVQKKMLMTFKEACGLKEVVVSKPTFSADGLRTVGYRHPDFEIVRAMVKSSVDRVPTQERQTLLVSD